MPLHLSCPHCRITLRVADGMEGKVIRCGNCRQMLAVAGNGSPAAPPTPAPAVSFRLDIGSATNRGRARERNEDCFLVQHLTWSDLDICRETAVVIVTDGLGGHHAGEQAARLVIRTVGGAMNELLAGALTRQTRTTVSDLEAHIAGALQAANQAVLAQARANPAWKGMAATAAIVLVWNGQVVIGHVGDCRVYHHRGGKLTQVTRDQTLVARMVEMGKLSPKEARSHPARNEVTQAVGLRPRLEPAFYQLWLQPGDTLLAASDGLHAHVDDDLIAAVIRETGYSASLLAQELIETANQGGGSDNVTVAAVNCY